MRFFEMSVDALVRDWGLYIAWKLFCAAAKVIAYRNVSYGLSIEKHETLIIQGTLLMRHEFNKREMKHRSDGKSIWLGEKEVYQAKTKG